MNFIERWFYARQERICLEQGHEWEPVGAIVPEEADPGAVVYEQCARCKRCQGYMPWDWEVSFE
jgi:hypothetical protein